MKFAPTRVSHGQYRAYQVDLYFPAPLSVKGCFMTQQTFVMIKPLGIRHGLLEILQRLRVLGTEIEGRLVVTTRELIAEHYAQHQSKEFFAKLVDYYDHATVLAAIYEGEGIIASVRSAIGHSNPRKAPADSIRKLVLDMFPDGEKGWAKSEQLTDGIDNFIHASDSPEAAQREIELWLPIIRALR